ncbi:MAG: hypothetical protein HZY75_06320 [Nocardioidaceae bacterium]|jgi:hypothetical protein|nr:MAG: hypothetical protein HZY75_06320 [Nocardioidaceae bacterium]
MATFNDPGADARAAQQAIRGLAHASRTIHDPRQIYEILGSLSSATSSLSQSLHQIASVHDGPSRSARWVAGETRAERAAAYQMAWELHRAGEILRQVAESIDRAHEAEGHITYGLRTPPEPSQATARTLDQGLGL